LLVDQGSLKLSSKIGLARRQDLPATIDQEAALAAIEEAMSGNPWVTLKTETDTDTLEYQVAVNEKCEYEIWDPAGQLIANLRPAIGIGAPNAPATVVSRLEHCKSGNAIKQLENHNPQSLRQLTVTWWVTRRITPRRKTRAAGVPGLATHRSCRPANGLPAHSQRREPATERDRARPSADWGISQVFPLDRATGSCCPAARATAELQGEPAGGLCQRSPC
jgi:hypothetical protein